MERILISERWTNSVGEEDGWCFVADETHVKWRYDALFDARTGDRSHTEADFDRLRFRDFVQVFRSDGLAELEGSNGISLTLARGRNKDVALSVRGRDIVGFATTIDAEKVDRFLEQLE